MGPFKILKRSLLQDLKYPHPHIPGRVGLSNLTILRAYFQMLEVQYIVVLYLLLSVVNPLCFVFVITFTFVLFVLLRFVLMSHAHYIRARAQRTFLDNQVKFKLQHLDCCQTGPGTDARHRT